MQIPGSIPFHSQPSMFQAILEECSMKDIEVEQQQPLHLLQHEPDIAKQEEPDNAWFWLHEAPFEQLLQDHQNTHEDMNLEFRRVKSLREQQETKIAQFLRADKCKSNRTLESPMKNQSPLGKYSQSLSPKKTKKIDKNRPLKLMQECT